MRKVIRWAPAVGLLAISLVLVGREGAAPAEATHGNLNVHVHDDYYHPAGAFVVGPGTDHALAATACQKASPDAACDAVIHEGDTITWVAPAPAAQNLHTVTECSNATFSVCGPNMSAANPIGDSGVRNPPPDTGSDAWPYGPVQFNTPGTYYYRCEVHPSVMRGRIVVQNVLVGGIAELPGGVSAPASESAGSSGAGEPVLALSAGAAVVALAALAGGVWYARRRGG